MNERKMADEPQTPPSPPAVSETPDPVKHANSTAAMLDALTQQVGMAMNLTDVIRKYEPERDPEEGRVRQFLTTPGVQQGFVMLVLCTAVCIPTRRFVLHVSNKHLRLGTVFPDLMISPVLAMVTAQLSLFTGSCYGSAAYLDRLANIPVDSPSTTADAVCHDDKFLQALSADSVAHVVVETKSWDPRQGTVQSLQRALQSCRERNVFRSQQEMTTTEEPNNSTRISWWK